MSEYLVIIFLLLVLNVAAIFIISSKNYFFTIINISLLSIVSTILYLVLRAPDVALTEAAIGVCISTVILLTCVVKLKDEKIAERISWPAVMISLVIFVVLSFFSIYLPEFGSSETNANSSELIAFYVNNTESQIGMKSVVAAILASFRGFDTFGETLVIFSAMLAVVLILDKEKIGGANEQK